MLPPDFMINLEKVSLFITSVVNFENAFDADQFYKSFLSKHKYAPGVVPSLGKQIYAEY